MNQFDPIKVEEMITAGKNAEAKAYIESFIKKDMSAEQKAAVHLDFMATYLKVMNIIKEERNANLRSLLSDLNLIDEAEKKSADKLSLAKVRADLAEK